MRSLGALLLASIAAVTLVGCGSSSPPPTVSVPARTESSASTTSTLTQASSSSASGPSRCVATDLRLSLLSQQGAMGHGVLSFELRNSSKHSCHTFGYPGVEFEDAAGHPLATKSVRTTHDFAGSAPERALVLAPGQSASFRLVVTHGAVPGSICATAAALQVIAPDDTATLHVSIPQGGAFECGTATVTPLQAGSSAAR